MYRLADEMDAQAEKRGDQALRDPYRRPADRPQGVGSRHEEAHEPVLAAEEAGKLIKDFLGKLRS